tara:strand:+ start:112252 stop:113613 length:1362 start_codon:yes stop_codon:yes gene_type:complete
VLFSFSLSSINADVFKKCQIHKTYLETQLNKIQEVSEYRDVTDDIRSLERVVRYSCSSSAIPAIENNLEEYRIEGLKSYIEFMKVEAELISYYKIPNFEIDEVKKTRELLKAQGIRDIPTGFSPSELTRFSSRGTTNLNIRRVNCRNVDNRKYPLENDIRNQDSVGWSYAYVAADLISHRVGKKVSAIDVANAYSNGNFSDHIGRAESQSSGGYIANAANAAIDRGLCLESQLPSDDYQFSTSKNLVQELVAIDKLYDTYYEATTKPGLIYGRNKKTGREFRRAQAHFEENLDCGRLDGGDWSKIFKSIDFEQFMSIIKRSTSKDDFFDKLVAKSCYPRTKINEQLHFQSDDSFTSRGSMMNTIDDRLERGEILGISYNSSVLNDPYDFENGKHASSIVARKFNYKTGSCEYLVRNSWGSSCNYSDSYECEEGNIWLPEDKLKRSIRGVTFID